MNVDTLKKLISNIKKGKVNNVSALDALRTLPFEEMEFATLDTHRSLRQGFPEVILGQGKTAAQIITIIKKMKDKKENILATRVDKVKAKAIRKAVPQAIYNDVARTLFIKSHPIKIIGKGAILVICAGTSDMSVAEEAVITAEAMGNKVERLYDVGVAGIHRLLHKKKKIISANVLIVVAGMEGALPSVVGGLVSRPVIAVPTSIGYGANLGGLTTLLAMLNSCVAGVTVVNIDNGFGAGYAASLINRG
ncbi:MAG: nickel pincer cofactor biosynthesis protein LarB [Deltaproteobacteria bacterium]|nr:nickel pincer cofactor biosynthesis protein LarB [Deltaproteobacteria bacterium]